MLAGNKKALAITKAFEFPIFDSLTRITYQLVELKKREASKPMLLVVFVGCFYFLLFL